MKLTQSEVEHIAQLARLEFSKTEKEKYSDELSAIINYVDELDKASVDDVASIEQISGLSNIAREDQVEPSLSTEKVLQNAPEKESNFIKVKKVFE